MWRPKSVNSCSVFVGSGMKPIRFEKKMKRASVAMKGNHFAAILRSMLAPTMLFWSPWKTSSTAVCTRFGRACMRRAT